MGHMVLGNLRYYAERIRWENGHTPKLLRDRIRLTEFVIERIGNTKTYKLTYPHKLLDGMKVAFELIPNPILFENGIVSCPAKLVPEKRETTFTVFFTNTLDLDINEALKEYFMDILIS